MISMIRTQAEEMLRQSLVRVFNIPDDLLEASVAQVVYPTETPLAHVAFPCHPLARHLRLAPQAIADRLSVDLQPSLSQSLLRDPRAVGGYLNFSVDVEALFTLIEEKKAPVQEIVVDHRTPGKVDVEFSQPNTHKALHVGHLRNMVFGDAVCNLLQAAGTRVVRSTFPGDFGAHVAKCLWFIRKFKSNEIPETSDPNWLGRMYCDSNACIKALEGTPEEFSARQEIGEVLRELETHSGENYDLYLKTRAWSLAQMEAVYRWLGIQFDRWYFESECDSDSRHLALAKYQEGFFRKSQGAVGLDLAEYDLGFA